MRVQQFGGAGEKPPSRGAAARQRGAPQRLDRYILSAHPNCCHRTAARRRGSARPRKAKRVQPQRDQARRKELSGVFPWSPSGSEQVRAGEAHSGKVPKPARLLALGFRGLGRCGLPLLSCPKSRGTGKRKQEPRERLSEKTTAATLRSDSPERQPAPLALRAARQKLRRKGGGYPARRRSNARFTPRAKPARDSEANRGGNRTPIPPRGYGAPQRASHHSPRSAIAMGSSATELAPLLRGEEATAAGARHRQG